LTDATAVQPVRILQRLIVPQGIEAGVEQGNGCFMGSIFTPLVNKYRTRLQELYISVRQSYLPSAKEHPSIYGPHHLEFGIYYQQWGYLHDDICSDRLANSAVRELE
jgi:hypothetical protein